MDKAAFKRYCATHELPTPRNFSSPDKVNVDVLIKKSRSSFGAGIIGPLALQSFGSTKYSLNDGEYFEEFVQGTIAKIWYWNDQVVCVSLDPMPTVVGDGETSLRNLIAKKREWVSFHTPSDAQIWEALARYQGYTLDSILPSQTEVLVDFRYNSPLHPPVIKNNNALPSLAGSSLLSDLTAVGAKLWSAIPQPTQSNTLFTVDAIVTPQRQLMLLEMNCNPLVQVDAYASMIRSIFAA